MTSRAPLDLTRFTSRPDHLRLVAPHESMWVSDCIEDLAVDVSALRDAPLSVQQRRLLRLIGDECQRLADTERVS